MGQPRHGFQATASRIWLQHEERGLERELSRDVWHHSSTMATVSLCMVLLVSLGLASCRAQTKIKKHLATKAITSAPYGITCTNELGLWPPACFFSWFLGMRRGQALGARRKYTQGPKEEDDRSEAAQML